MGENSPNLVTLTAARTVAALTMLSCIFSADRRYTETRIGLKKINYW
jgi:hypothetical protein